MQQVRRQAYVLRVYHAGREIACDGFHAKDLRHAMKMADCTYRALARQAIDKVAELDETRLSWDVSEFMSLASVASSINVNAPTLVG